MKYPIFSKREPSDLIEDLVSRFGTPVQECEYCGRTNYDLTGEYMDEDENGNQVELEKLKKEHEANPEGYFAQPWTIHWGNIFGKSSVIGCPCNILARLEQQIWNDRFLIAEYLTRRAAEQLKDAKQDTEAVEGLSEAIANT